MKWLTIPQIKHRSKTAKGALKVSYEHWCQLYDATAKELRRKIFANPDIDNSEYCGLCKYNYNTYGTDKKCYLCVFKPYCPRPYETPLWGSAHDALKSWYNKTGGDWHSWKRACEAVRDKLGELFE